MRSRGKELLLVLLVVCAAWGNALQVPQDIAGGDVAAPGQGKAERKLIKNIIQGYGMFRQIALCFIEDVNALLGVAWAVQNQLNAIENLALRIERLSQNIENFQWNPSDPIGMIIRLEEDIMQHADGIVLQVTQVIPANQKAINRSAVHVKDLAVDQYGRASHNINTAIAYIRKTEKDSLLDLQAEKVAAVVQSTVSRDGDQFKTDPLQLAHSNLIVRRTELAMNYQYHEEQAEKISYLSEILIMKTRNLANTHAIRTLYVSSFDLSD